MVEEAKGKTTGPSDAKPGGDGQATAIKPASRMETFRDLLQKYRANFAQVIPQTIRVEKLMQVALAAIGRNEKLAVCTPASILRSIMVAAQLGLDPSGVLGSAYLVPFWNTKLGRYEAQFIIGYRGMIDLARRSGEIAGVEARVVYEKDQFEYRLGLEPMLTHVPSLDDDPGKARCAYAIVRVKDAPVPLVEIMSWKQIEVVRSRSRAAQEGPWVDFWSEMARKTVLRRIIKYAPLSVEAAQAIDVTDRVEVGEDVSDVIALPDIEEEVGTAEKPGSTKSERVADQLKTAQERAREAVPVGEGGKAAPSPEPPAPAPPVAQEPAATVAQEDGQAEPPTEDKGPGPGWPRSISTAKYGTFTFQAPAEFEAFQDQCLHPTVTPTGMCERCEKSGVLKLEPDNRSARRARR